MDFGELYDRYARDVYRFSLFLCGNSALADDLTAETFTRALVGQDKLRVDTVKAYLFAIARNLHRDALRSERRLVPLTDTVPESADRAPSVDVVAGDRQTLDVTLLALARLPDGEREALVLAVDQDLSYEQIAAILGCSIAAVKVRIHRARLKLRCATNGKESLS